VLPDRSHASSWSAMASCGIRVLPLIAHSTSWHIAICQTWHCPFRWHAGDRRFATSTVEPSVKVHAFESGFSGNSDAERKGAMGILEWLIILIAGALLTEVVKDLYDEGKDRWNSRRGGKN
jgi:hypothetical protein